MDICYYQYSYVCMHIYTDPTLTHDNILRLLESSNDVKIVDTLAYYLDMPFNTRDRLEKEHRDRLRKENKDSLSTEDENRLQKIRMSALISEWLAHHPAPTWRLVVNAFSWMGRKDSMLREALRVIYKPNNFYPGE